MKLTRNMFQKCFAEIQTQYLLTKEESFNDKVLMNIFNACGPSWKKPVTWSSSLQIWLQIAKLIEYLQIGILYYDLP